MEYGLWFFQDYNSGKVLNYVAWLSSRSLLFPVAGAAIYNVNVSCHQASTHGHEPSRRLRLPSVHVPCTDRASTHWLHKGHHMDWPCMFIRDLRLPLSAINTGPLPLPLSCWPGYTTFLSSTSSFLFFLVLFSQ